jgi:hypothetical protein
VPTLRSIVNTEYRDGAAATGDGIETEHKTAVAKSPIARIDAAE